MVLLLSDCDRVGVLDHYDVLFAFDGFALVHGPFAYDDLYFGLVVVHLNQSLDNL